MSGGALLPKEEQSQCILVVAGSHVQPERLFTKSAPTLSFFENNDMEACPALPPPKNVRPKITILGQPL